MVCKRKKSQKALSAPAIDLTFLLWHSPCMAYEVEFLDEFELWWHGLSRDLQESVGRAVRLLQEIGPRLGRPHVDTLKGSKHLHMKELRIRYRGDAYRVLFAFDPRRVAILLCAGRKAASSWYHKMIPLADKLYDRHLATLKKEGLL
jgi:hypothetical protein